MKKFSIIFVVFIFFIINNPVWADDLSTSKEFFNIYIDKCATFSNELPELFAPNAVIKRGLLNKDGTKSEITLSKEQYVQKLKKYAYIAKMFKYKNNYSNLTYAQEGDMYRVRGYRSPSTDHGTTKYAITFLVGKDKNGEWKIFEDYTEMKNRNFKNFFKR